MKTSILSSLTRPRSISFLRNKLFTNHGISARRPPKGKNRIAAWYDMLKRKHSSSTESLVKVNYEHDKCIATMLLNRPPVNSLSLEMCQSISGALAEIESHAPKIHGFVLASTTSAVLSAGVDLQEMHRPDPDRLARYWRSLQQVFVDIYGSRLASVVAIEGHAIAGGCLLALSCHHRIMASPSPSLIGLNETRLGLVAPPWLCDLYARTLGPRVAERALALGTLFGPEEALRVGLVDELTPLSDVITRAESEAVEWISGGDNVRAARVESLHYSRRRYLEEFESRRDKDVEEFVERIMKESTQEALEKYLEGLKQKSREKKEKSRPKD